jgi:hypothetical protein
MNHKRWFSIICISALPLLACFSFGIWFAEIIFKGWAGIAWISYSHESIFVSLFLFVAWMVATAELESMRKRAIFVLACAGVSALFYWFYFIEIFPLVHTWFAGVYLSWLYLGPLFIAFAMTVIWLVFKKQFSLIGLFVSLALMYSSVLFGQSINYLIFGNAFGTLTVFGNAAQNNFIHTIKTGSILVLLITGAGYSVVHYHVKKLIPWLEKKDGDGRVQAFVKKYVL